MATSATQIPGRPGLSVLVVSMARFGALFIWDQRLPDTRQA